MRASLLAGPVVLLSLAGCGESPKASVAAEPAPFSTRFPTHLDDRMISARVAVTETELATGLMNTTSLPAGEGMVFVYRDIAARAFWMANVPYDIDIGFFDASGRLDEVRLLKANDTTPVSSKSATIRYALEAPAGWFAGQGLRPGSRLDRDALGAALEARGFARRDFIGKP